MTTVLRDLLETTNIIFCVHLKAIINDAYNGNANFCLMQWFVLYRKGCISCILQEGFGETTSDW